VPKVPLKPNPPAKASRAGNASKPKIPKVAKPKVTKIPKAEEVASRLRIRVRAYESKILDLSVKQIIDTALRYDARVQGPIPLPTEIKKYTVNRAAFVYKNAREQFEMRIHKRLIDILNPTPKIIESLTNLSLPSGVNIDVKLI
jgi:small subunit ribosomal protein S10